MTRFERMVHRFERMLRIGWKREQQLKLPKPIPYTYERRTVSRMVDTGGVR